MKFLQKIFKWDVDQSLFEKILTLVLVVGLIIIGLGYFGILGSYGVGASHNFIAQHAREAGFAWKIPGTILLLVSVWWDSALYRDKEPIKIADELKGFSVIALWALVIAFNCGFRF